MRSRLYEGAVWHERQYPSYRMEHSVFYIGLDLGEAELVAKKVSIFSHNRFNLLSIRDSDYDLLKRTEQAASRAEMFEKAGSRTSLLTVPRIGGYVFNPVSFLLVRDPQGALIHVVAEVHNTWGERHIYDLARSDETDTYRSTVTKAFYVSPLLEAEASYDFEVQEDAAGRLQLLITETTAAGLVFSAGLTLQPKALSTSSFLWALVRFPFLNLKVIGAIHWHAFRIWLRGAKFHSHPKPKTRPPEVER